MESFHLTADKSTLLRHHALLDQEFHANYRLWLISQEAKDVRFMPCMIYNTGVFVQFTLTSIFNSELGYIISSDDIDNLTSIDTLILLSF